MLQLATDQRSVNWIIDITVATNGLIALTLPAALKTASKLLGLLHARCNQRMTARSTHISFQL